MDGNNSLKRMSKPSDADPGIFPPSEYNIPAEFVNQFAHEVQLRRSQPARSAPASTALSVTHDIVPTPNDSTDPPEPPADHPLPAEDMSPCAERWKAANGRPNPHTWDLLKETGVFGSACPHGMILWMMDMIQSGELYASFFFFNLILY